MRTTVRLDEDVLAAVSMLQRERHLSLSEAVNSLARAGQQRSSAPQRPFVQRTTKLGITVDISNTAEALEYLDGVDHQ
ncbi:MAG: CopG family transcriptional regulator [Propionibacteriaceae bacterium]|jgi:hypothetical protein|nr:CopG family transcriptional regulator [Propionibacteriaceae bacterium]